jgi:hypothetical protein
MAHLEDEEVDKRIEESFDDKKYQEMCHRKLERRMSHNELVLAEVIEQVNAARAEEAAKQGDEKQQRKSTFGLAGSFTRKSKASPT